MGVHHSEGAKPIASIRSTTKQIPKTVHQTESRESEERLYAPRMTPPRKSTEAADDGLCKITKAMNVAQNKVINPHLPFGKLRLTFLYD